MKTCICLKTKVNRMGNSKRVFVYLESNQVREVVEGGSHSGCALTITVAPSEVNDLVKQAKKAGIYK